MLNDEPSDPRMNQAKCVLAVDHDDVMSKN